MDPTLKPLPLDCEAGYCHEFLSAGESAALFEELAGGYQVEDRKVQMAGGLEVEIETGIYFFTDPELTSYDAFPATWGKRSPWPERLAAVRRRVEAAVGHQFQVARCVHYRDGGDTMDFHHDPSAYGPTDAIASLSLGARREFAFRRSDDHGDIYRMELGDGSLLFMGEGCQERYEHAVPAAPGNTAPRLNLTFRKYGWG